jgi:hypothetical protein
MGHTKTMGLSVLSAVFFLAGCGGGSSSSTSTTSTSSSSATTDASFPTQLALVSPTVSGSAAATGAVVHAAFVSKRSVEPSGVKDYKLEADDIKEVLSDRSKFSAKFSVSHFLEHEQGNAPCYGPTMYYQNHPDGSTPTSGQMPSGDLGIWRDTVSADGTTDTTACAAAQLNRSVFAASRRVNMGLKALAMLRAISFASTGAALTPGAAPVELKTEMPTMTGVVFNSATLARDSTGDVWTYAIDMTYTDSSSKSYTIQFSLQHTRTSGASYPYSGVLTYKISDTVTAGNCPNTGAGKDVVHVGTLKYNRTTSTHLEVNHRTGQYCGGLSNLPTNLVNSDGQLNAAAKYNLTSGQGWADNFNRFAAVYDPSDSSGQYVYAWQAGYGDGNARILGVNLNAGKIDGEAWFGFGDAIDSTDGTIKGMICNWAGPGNSHSYQPYAQRQSLKWNSTLSIWEVPTGGADIRYAPTNSCQYAGGASFWYDRDLTNDPTTASSSQADLVVDPTNSTYPFDLKGKGTSLTLSDMMAARGYSLPSNF